MAAVVAVVYITWSAVRSGDICTGKRGMVFLLTERGSDQVGDKILYQNLHIAQRQAP